MLLELDCCVPASTSPRRVESGNLMFTYFRNALVRILPRNLRTHCVAQMDRFAGMKGEDLNPIEVVKALTEFRIHIDTVMENQSLKKDKKSAGIKLHAAAPSAPVQPAHGLLPLQYHPPSTNQSQPQQPNTIPPTQGQNFSKKGKKGQTKKAAASQPPKRGTIRRRIVLLPQVRPSALVNFAENLATQQTGALNSQVKKGM